MSELSAKIAALKGSQTTKELIGRIGLSRETWRKIERGETVKLSTLRQIAEALGLEEQSWVELLIAWVKTEIGPEAAKLWIESKQPSELHEMESNQSARALMLFKQLNSADRQQILSTMQRKEVLNCLPSLNQLWDKIDRRQDRDGSKNKRYELPQESPSGKPGKSAS